MTALDDLAAYDRATNRLLGLIRGERAATSPKTDRIGRATARLARTLALLEAFGNPQHRYSTVHVTGTSGKGSVAAMIAAILSSAGYRVGLRTSPYLQVATEKLQISSRLIDANSVSGRDVLDVGTLVGVPTDGNPHRWYSPSDVQQVIDAITLEYTNLDPADASFFDRQRSTFQTTGLAQYHALISEIKTKYGGTPIGASESIFALMAPALGLNLITPPSFLTAISEGSEPTAADKSSIDHQISSHEIEVYVYNSQNATPDIQRQIDEATAANIPITTITETLFPAGATFQAWQVAQLRTLAAALHEATGR